MDYSRNDMNEEEFYSVLREIKEKEIIDTNNLPFYMLNTNFFRNSKDYTMYEKMVYIDLACYAGKDRNLAYPSIKTIAKDIGASERTVQYAIKSLQDKGGLLVINRVWENNAKTSNMYILAGIDLETGKFNPRTLDYYRHFKETAIKVFKNKNKY